MARRAFRLATAALLTWVGACADDVTPPPPPPPPTMTDGGFDPVPVRAATGDSIEIEIRLANGMSIALLGDRAPVRRRPSSGNVLWRRQFGSKPGPFIDADFMGDIVVDRLGGVYVGGSTNGSFDDTPTTGENDAFVVKLDAEGNKLWERQLRTDKHDYVYDLAADPDGGVYLTGLYNFSDAYVARYSPDGTRLWNRVLDGGNADNGSGVAVNASTVYLVGFTRVVPHESRESGQGKIDGFLAEFSRTGDLRSFRLLGGPEDDFAFRVALGLNGGVYLLAGTWGGLPDIPNPATLLARHRSAAP